MTDTPEMLFDPRMIDMIPVEQRREFVDMFVSEVRSQLKRLQDVIPGGVRKEIDFVLHALKGVCGYFGALHVMGLCESLRGRTMEKYECNAALENMREQL